VGTLVRAKTPSAWAGSIVRVPVLAARRALLAGVLAVFLSQASPAAAVEPQPYQAGDYGSGGFHDVVPPGENGLTNVVGLARFDVKGTRPAHSFDQYPMYANLLYRAPGLTAAEIPNYVKDASFGVPPGHVAGINLYIDEAKLNPALMPPEHLAIDQPFGLDPWKVIDLQATATLIGDVLGSGGGSQLARAAASSSSLSSRLRPARRSPTSVPWRGLGEDGAQTSCT